MSRKISTHFTQKASSLLLGASALGLLLMTFIIGWQVFGRFVLNSSPSWSEQAALTLMIWFVFLAGAAGIKEGFHIRIVAIETSLSKSHQRKLRIASNIIVGLCGLAMAWWGSELVIRTWSHVIPSLGVPRGLAYLCIPISGVLITLFSVEKILKDPDVSPEKKIGRD